MKKNINNWKKIFLIATSIFFISAYASFSQDFYWEDERAIIKDNAEFSRTESNKGIITTVWQDMIRTNADGGEFYLSMATSFDGIEWQKNKRFLGPYSYTGKQNYFFSQIIDESGAIIIAVSEEDFTVSIYRSEDNGKNFKRINRSQPFEVRVSPKLSLRSDGGIILFVTLEDTGEQKNSLGIFYSISEDGFSWTEYKQLSKDENLKGNFLPSHVSYKGKEYVVFQSYYAGSPPSFQLYLKYSEDGGLNWSTPVYLSNFGDSKNNTALDSKKFDNQRPFLAKTPYGLRLVWERGAVGQNSQIFYAELDVEGQLSYMPVQISRGSAKCKAPKLIYYNNSEYILWFDNRVGSYHNIMAKKNGNFWEENDLNYQTKGSSFFGNFFINNNELFVLWENEYQNKKSLMLLSPDKSINSVVLRAANFVAGRPAAQDNFTIRWNSPEDSSGIVGFSYIWGRDKNEKPPESIKMFDKNRKIELDIKEDGKWYFSVIAQDYAGNWSKPSTIELIRDFVPPSMVNFSSPDVDAEGAMLSNTGSVIWNSVENDIDGYSYSMQYINNWDRKIDNLKIQYKTPAPKVITKKRKYDFNNIDDGLWALNVRAIDQAGNAGDTNTILLRFNKYIPVTYISAIDSSNDNYGVVKLELQGRGFSVGGHVSSVLLDRDAMEPWDYVYNSDDGSYFVESDRIISGPLLEGINAGIYRIGLIHPSRGIYFTEKGIELEASGIVKLGDFSYVPSPVVSAAPLKKYSIQFKDVIIILIIVLLLFLLIFTLWRTTIVLKETKVIKKQAMALIDGKIITESEKEMRKKEMAKIRFGLRLKFILLFTVLVIIVVLMISIPVAYLTSNNQKEVLSTGLEERAKVLIESVTSGARTFLPSENIIELSTLPSQMTAMGDDAVFITITGEGNQDSKNYDPDKYDYVWVTNNQEIQDKAKNPRDYLMKDEISTATVSLMELINEQAEAKVSGIVKEIERLNQQVNPLISDFIKSGSKETETRINQIQIELRNLDNELNKRLYDIGNRVGSYPQYNPEELHEDITEYVFYKPVVYRNKNSNNYFHGMIRLGVSTVGILSRIKESTIQLVKVIIIIAAIAIGLGILGALILASVIVRPINLLVEGVEIIRDTNDKESLKDFRIEIKTGDEIALLAKTVNQMVEGLVEAGAANKLLTVGKEVQKKFIPLEEDSAGNKLTIGRAQTNNIEFFGYYEGARGVSGDYFDFRKIDDVHFAAIKCDVAGKGVPASLIMVEVATIFLDFFKNKKSVQTASGKIIPPDISELTYNINDLVEEVGFTGRFAAFTIAIINSETGELFLCNAGDNIVHIYDSKKNKMIVKELPESPASGVFPSDMIRMGTGFIQVKDKLNRGDSLLMFTDGLEEAQRHLRNDQFKIIKPELSDDQKKELPESVNPDDGFEEFGLWRLQDLINTLKKRGQYKLVKYYNPIENENLVFDFSNLKGTTEDIILGAVSVEKIFRIYPDPLASFDDRVVVDKVIVEFLRNNFNLFNQYFSHPLPSKEEDHYITFTNLKEDDQYDDLTVLGISKK